MIASPFQLWTLGFRTGVMLAEAQTVVLLRLWGMAGLWPVGPSESTRMVAEKWPAFLHDAALTPIARKTRANSRRLVRGSARRRK